MPNKFSHLRKGLWHLRTGGFEQYRKWKRRSRYGYLGPANFTQLKDADDMVRTDIYPHMTPVDRPKSFPGLKVGVILDDFSLHAWSPEFETVLLTPGEWQSQLARESIDFLFVEAAWAGNHGAWQYQFTGSQAPRAEIRDLVAHCQDSGIPTVFWNKEDPSHFEDFIETAKLFDHIFTTDATLIPKYRETLGHNNVDVLSFAAQTSIHNPIRIRGLDHQEGIAFAGMYFKHKFPERRQQMDVLFNAALNVVQRGEHGFDIFSRHHGGNENYQFPAPFDAHVVGALDYNQMLVACKNYKVFLNVNSVTSSPSMCARRVFELLASGTPVVSGDSAAIPEFFTADQVPVVRDEPTARFILRTILNSPELRDRMVHSAQREIWNHHTYTHRAGKIIDTLGLGAVSPLLRTPLISALTSTNRPDFVHHAIDSVARQRDVDVEMVMLTHGFEENETELRAYAAERGIERFTLLSAPASVTLGECLNRLVEASSGDVLAKIDDDDYYAPYYLHDSINTMRFANADLVGKFATYMYSEADDMLTLRNPGKENMYTDFITGATMVGRRELFESVPFLPLRNGEDSRFLNAVENADAKIFAGDRFNFLQMRGAHKHTWSADLLELYANSVVVSYGYNPRHVEC